MHKNIGTSDRLKGAVFIIIGLAGVVFLILFLLSNQGIIFNRPQGPKIVSKQEVSFQQLPPGFPENLSPTLNEIEGKVLENYQATLDDGRIQTARVFESKLSALDEIKEGELNSFDEVHFLLFEFLKSGWVVTETEYSESQRRMKAVKDSSELVIEISQDPSSGAIKVSLNQFSR